MEVILTHEQADFDAAGSLLAAWLLDRSRIPVIPKRQNRNLAAFLNDYKNDLPFFSWKNVPKGQISRALITDTQLIAEHKRLEGLTDVIVWDHHPHRHIYPDREENIYEQTGACTTFLVEKLGTLPDTRIGRIYATLMLMGIYEDTGFLSYGTTTSRDIRAAAWLVDHGADTDLLRRYVLTPFTDHQQQACDELLKNCENYTVRGKQILIAPADVREISDEFSAVAHHLRDMMAPDGLVLVLCTKSGIRLICRGTTDDIDFGGLMKAFSGGGHVRAASALIPAEDPEHMDAEGEMRKIRDELLRALPDYIQAPKRNLWGKLSQMLSPAQQSLIAQAAEAAEMLGMPIYIVGGVVRDLLLGRPMMDLDIVTEGDAVRLGNLLTEVHGGKLTVHPQFFTAKWLPGDGTSLDLISARSETYAAPGALPTVTRGSMKEDLQRRDFTINTLAVRLDGPKRGEVLDLCGGMADLQDRLIRTLHDRSFIDDPTRIFRAVRFEQRFGFALEAETEKQLGLQLGGIAGLTGQRIWHELKLYCAEPYPEENFARISALGAAGQIHRGLVWTDETEADCERYRTNSPEDYWGPHTSAEVTAAAEEGPLWVWLSALPGNTLTELAKRLLLPKRTVQGISQMARLRKELPAYNSRKASETAFFLDGFGLGALWCYARFCSSDAEKALVRSYICSARELTGELSGDDLHRMGIAPGPRMRELLQELRAGRIDGTICSKEDEILWLRNSERKDL